MPQAPGEEEEEALSIPLVYQSKGACHQGVPEGTRDRATWPQSTTERVGSGIAQETGSTSERGFRGPLELERAVNWRASGS